MAFRRYGHQIREERGKSAVFYLYSLSVNISKTVAYKPTAKVTIND